MDCGGCGACCDPVWLAMDPLEVARCLALDAAGRRFSTREGEVNVRFIAEHMTPLVPQPESYYDGEPAATSGHTAWRCDKYDPVSRLCTAHDDRPPICRGYPWYGDEPRGNATAVLPGCSHLWDLKPGDRGPLPGRLLPLWPAVSARQDDAGVLTS